MPRKKRQWCEGANLHVISRGNHISDSKPSLRQASQGYDPWGRELFPGTCTSDKSINLLINCNRAKNFVVVFSLRCYLRNF